MLGLIRSIDVGRVNMAMCDFLPSDHKILQWHLFPAASIHRLFKALDDRPLDPSHRAHVVIEAQSKRSVKMLALQHWIQGYYVLKGLPVTIFSARHKLAGTGQENRGPSNYRARKKASVALATAWLQEHPQDPSIHHLFSATKKKDDAADTLNQALAFARLPVSPAAPAPTRITCRRPTLHQQRTGRYSQSNIKHIVTKDWKCKDLEALTNALASDQKVAKAVKRHWASATACWVGLDQPV